MEILIDSADPIEIREVALRGLIHGVTTNPTHYAHAARGMPFEDLLRQLIEASPGYLFTQVIGGGDTEPMLGQARWLARQSEKIVVKLPMTPAGIEALIRLKRTEPAIKVAVTAVASVSQALIAGLAGADVVALFNGPLDTVSDTPVELVGPVRRIYAHSGIDTKILSCGRFSRGVGEYAAAGTDMVTLRKEYLDQLYMHPYTEQRLNGFMADWKTVFGDRTWPEA
jgi:transaldolase